MTTKFVEGIGSLGHRETSPDPRWLRARRAEALRCFEKQGLPTLTDEDWRNTNLAPIRGTRFGSAPPPRKLPEVVPGRDWTGERVAQLTFLDGDRADGPSRLADLPDGVWAGSLARALQEIPERLRNALGTVSTEQPTAFESLNTAFAHDGLVLLVPDGTQVETPIQATHLASETGEPVLSHPRTLVVAGKGSRVTLVELFAALGSGTYLTNAAAEVHVGDNASVDHVRVQLESEKAYHVSTSAARLRRDGRYTHTNIDLGGKLVRHDLRTILDGEGASCDLLGLYLTRGSQHVDNHTVLDHARSYGRSRELYKGILDGDSRAVFRGRIIVREDAQKTDAKQSNPNLVLSPGALAHTRPQLEIYADDVKCTHGATVGRLDEEAVFYLRSRAIPEREARNMMIRAFAGEVLDKIRPEALREALEHEVLRRLPGSPA